MYRFNVYVDWNKSEFKCLDAIWVDAENREKAKEFALKKAKEMYQAQYPGYEINVMATN